MIQRIIVILAILILFLTGARIWFNLALSSKSPNAGFKTFVIPPGESVEKIAKRLKYEGFINNSLAFRILVALNGTERKIQAGNFKLSPAQSGQQIARELTLGTFDVWITIPEGWRIEEIAERLEEKVGINKSEFVKNAREGFMFPDTYLIPKNAKASDIAKMMLENFEARIDANLRKKAEDSGLILEQIIILASIVEREVKFDKDRGIVAGVLLKRWKNNLPLEADATVQYALGYQVSEKSWWKKELTDSDLKINSPYNTRRFAGLPPRPICNPGLASIKSMIEPVETNFLYYLSDKEGKMRYAKTLPEHIENIRNYL